MERNVLVPPYEDIEIDKIPGAWVVTYWRPDGVTLRLKVRHSSVHDPEDFVFEVRVKPDDEFQAIDESSMAVCSLLHPEDEPEIRDEMPDALTGEFAKLAAVWARLTHVAEFGASVAAQYASEPHSSRDHFLLPTSAERKGP